jgi:hypothetical protein
MAILATIITFLALAGAVASWVAAALCYVRAGAASGSGRLRCLTIVAWPFATRRLSGIAAEHAARVNKALVAFFACLTIAAAAWSVASNLNRLAR